MLKYNEAELIVFDFDYTLFDPEEWRNKVYKKLAEILNEDVISFREYAKLAYTETRKVGYFDPKLFAKSIADRFQNKVSLEKILDAIYDPELIENCYYPEVLTTLKTLSESRELAIFSTNDREFFMHKFNPIKSFFNIDNIFVSGDKEELLHIIINLSKKYKTVFVDDILEILIKVKRINDDVRIFWIKRGPYAAETKLILSFKPDYTIYNLSELESVIN